MKHLYSAIIFLLFAVLFVASESQKGVVKTNEPKNEPLTCSYSHDKSDPFSKKRNVSTFNYLIYTEKYSNPATELNFRVKAESKDGKKIFYLTKEVFRRKDFPPVLGEFLTVKFLLSNEDIIILKPDIGGGYEVLEEDGFYRDELSFFLDDATWTKFKNNNVKIIRFGYYANDKTIGEQDIIVKQEYQSKITFVLKCIDDLNLPEK